MNRELHGISSVVIVMIFIGLLLFSSAITGISGVAWIAPWFLSCGVFYWGLFKPRELPLIWVFLVGIIQDGMSGAPFGLHALGLVIIYHLAVHQKHYLEKSHFFVVWTAFAINLLVVTLLLALIMWFLGSSGVYWELINWLVTIMIFPVIYKLMYWLHLALIREE